MRIQFKGWVAVPVVALVVLFLSYRAVSARTALDGEQGERIKLHLQGVYAAELLPEARENNVEELLGVDAIEFTNVSVKGTGDEVIVKVEIEVAGGPPPDGKATRYYMLRHQTAFGWKVEREVSAFAYYLKLF